MNRTIKIFNFFYLLFLKVDRLVLYKLYNKYYSMNSITHYLIKKIYENGVLVRITLTSTFTLRAYNIIKQVKKKNITFESVPIGSLKKLPCTSLFERSFRVFGLESSPSYFIVLQINISCACSAHYSSQASGFQTLNYGVKVLGFYQVLGLLAAYTLTT